MAKKKKLVSDSGTYTEEEKTRWLYRTAEEMRKINDKADARRRNNAQREEQELEEQKFFKES
jgi:hypothetical protein